MADSHVAKNPELRQAASMVRVTLPPSDIDLELVQQNISKAQHLIDSNDTTLLESSLDAIEKIKALRNKFNLGD